ncbi:MAG: phosphodiester glycosidase family protein, partial [Firmicutes bacterium]|nr:phosphodiester glycosidase family protein [Bacillota bacterium]
MKINKKMLKRAGALALAVSLFMTCLTGFAKKEGFGSVYKADTYEIFDNTYYTMYRGEHASNGIETAHVVTADIKSGKLKAFVMNGEVRSTGRVGDFISYLENQGYKVIAGINGDIFDTSSGTAKGLVIHDGNIVTGGYASDRVIAITKDGDVSLEPAKLQYNMDCTIEWQQEVASGTAIQVPVEKERTVTVEEPVLDENGNPVLDENGNPVTTTVEKTETYIDYETQESTETVYETITKQKNLEIGFFNVPHGGANALHLYNRQYGTSTKTTGSNAEAVIEVNNVQLR